MILNKKTNYLRSVSLNQEEFSALSEGKVKRIDVESMDGKHLKTVEVPPPSSPTAFRRFIGKAKLLLTQHRFSDGDQEVRPPEQQSHYYVLNLA